jgi:hypothetical protein
LTPDSPQLVRCLAEQEAVPFRVTFRYRADQTYPDDWMTGTGSVLCERPNMSCVCILTPVVIAAWPAVSAAVAAAATSLGYAVVEGAQRVAENRAEADDSSKTVEMEIANSTVVTDRLGRDQKITLVREGITVTFSRDARGRAALCVSGEGSREQLRAQGEELSRCVVQHYVYQKIKEELQNRQYLLVEEEIDENRAIRMKVRHWEN